MSNDLSIPFDRITYRDGQLLTVRDLRDDQRRHARLRRLHTRYLHETWGITLGLKVSRATGNRAAVVGPGYAIDGAGRDILLAEGMQVPVPNTTGPAAFVLTLSYQEDAMFRERPDLASLCLSGGLDPRYERPLFSWRQPGDVRFGPEVPLVQVIVVNGAIQGELDFRVRRNARPLVRPYIGWDMTEPGRTGWRLWQEGEQGSLGLEVIVDTSEAGFTKTPYYFAALQGDFSNRPGETPLFQPHAWPTGTEPAFFLGAFSFIAHATPDSFTYRILSVEPFLFGREITRDEAENRRWTVSWFGAEPVTGCEPLLDLGRLFTLSGVLAPELALFPGTNGG